GDQKCSAWVSPPPAGSTAARVTHATSPRAALLPITQQRDPCGLPSFEEVWPRGHDAQRRYVQALTVALGRALPAHRAQPVVHGRVGVEGLGRAAWRRRTGRGASRLSSAPAFRERHSWGIESSWLLADTWSWRARPPPA